MTADKTLKSNIIHFTLLAGVIAVVSFLGMSVLLPAGFSLATQSVARASSPVLWKGSKLSVTGGKMEFEGTVKNGRAWDGQAKYHHSDGSVEFDGSIRDGKAWDGQAKYHHSDGSIKFQGLLNKGEPWTGKLKLFYPSGSVKFDDNIVEGRFGFY
jgi:hypothetical protein